MPAADLPSLEQRLEARLIELERLHQAKIYPEPEKGGRGKKGCATQEFVEGSRPCRARTVLRCSTGIG